MRLWWVPLGAFVLFWAFLGLRWGWIAVKTTETDVIETYASRYLTDRERDGTGTDARITDCVAYPGETPGIWIVVSCGPTPLDLTRHYEYYVNRLGGLEWFGGPETWRDDKLRGPGQDEATLHRTEQVFRGPKSRGKMRGQNL